MAIFTAYTGLRTLFPNHPVLHTCKYQVFYYYYYFGKTPQRESRRNTVNLLLYPAWAKHKFTLSCLL